MNFIRRHVFHNVGLKLLSLAIAVLLWWAVSHDPMAEIAVTVPIEFHHVPENLEISSESIPQAQIRVRGPARAIRELVTAEIHPVIDLRGISPGERTFDITARQIGIPQDIEIVQIVPTQLRVSFDNRAQRDIEVRPRVIGTFASGYRIAEAVPDPRTITIVGPEKRVNSIESAITDPVDASGVMGRATFSTNAYIADPLVRPMKPGPIRVTVITEKSLSRPGVP
ncbi:MAG TPA: CdaR family protein [Clostridia bacterium]|nr:CdaR family protein [Clostridia bacterium]